jgi:D-amino-acid dehydrogenase
MKIAVIGAGITGITTAYSLARRGVDVTVYDENFYPAMKTSYANGGQLSVSNSDVWTTIPNIIKGLKWMTKKDAPLLINPSPSMSKYKWIAAFLYHSVSVKAVDNTIQTAKIGLEARKFYMQIAEQEKIDFDLKKKGILHFFKNQEYFESAKRSCEEVYAKVGMVRYILTKNQVMEYEPSLQYSAGIIGGTYTPHDMSGDIHKFCIELEKVLKTKYNVKFVYGTKFVKSLINDYDNVVLCGGVASTEFSKIIGDPLNIYPVKGYSITIDVGNTVEDAPVISLLDDEAKIVSSRLGTRLRVAGTAELAGINYDIRQDRIDPLVKWVRNNFPYIRTEHVNPWAGLRPMTPNMMPIVRQSKNKKVWYNTGHGHLGWTLSAATAEMITDQIFNAMYK